ncbi:MAG: M4 family metallopeptidase [Acidobacteriota bacterium]|nr:M4 family metallopeptidase [Acidobacteriota bacterium]
MAILTTVGATIIFQQAPITTQQPQSRQTISAVGLSEVRDSDAIITRQLRTGELRAYRSRQNPFRPDLRSERLAQYHRGVPVYGADVSRQTTNGLTTAVFGTLFNDIHLDTIPGLPLRASRAVFDKLAGPAFKLADTPELWILPLDDDYKLAYRGTLTDMRTVFIDADSGDVLFEFSLTNDQTIGQGAGRRGDLRKMSTEAQGGAFRTRDLARPAQLRTLDMGFDAERFYWRSWEVYIGDAPTSLQDLAADTDNRWTDATVVDTHTALGWTYDYFVTQFGWAGIDGVDGPIDAFVHPFDAQAVMTQHSRCEPKVETEECAMLNFLVKFVDNAAYFSPGYASSTGIMVFGEPFYLPEPLTSVDIVAHEMAHGVTFFTAGLGHTSPPNEPGALNEGFSDIIGTAVEFYTQQAGSGPLRADYLIGEDSEVVVRSLRNPQELSNRLTGPYPDHYSKLFLGPEDDGGVHINATILGHLYYLAIEGGTNRTSGRTVTGVGSADRLSIERVFFNAWANLLPGFANFPIAADSLTQSAIDLFGIGSSPTIAIAEAIAAVGIPSRFNCEQLGGCQ